MFRLLYGGCQARHMPPFEMARPDGLDHYVLLLVKTGAEFRIAGQAAACAPNSALVLDVGTPYSYASLEKPYVDDWVHFTGRPEDFPGFMDYPFNTLIPLENVSRLTMLLGQALWEQSYAWEAYRGDNVDALLRVLLRNIRAAREEQKAGAVYHPYRARLRSLRLSFQAAPYKSYRLEDAASRLGISASYFQKLYTETFGVSFRADLIAMRVEYAKGLLQSTDLPISRIAEQSGYSSEVHFYRQFQKLAGCTPSAFRRGQDASGR